MSTPDNDKQCSDSGEIASNKKECISCEQINVNNITEDIDSLAVLDDMSTCASCGKEGNSNDMNTCNKCKMVKYCNAACKKKHRTKHKKACERRVAELHDKALFKEVEREECPICLLPIPLDASQSIFYSCCGKVICNGCIYAMEMSEGKDLCAFCRSPETTSIDEQIGRIKKLMDRGNAGAHYMKAGDYAQGIMGMPVDLEKSNQLLLKAGELGCAEAYYNLGQAYDQGRGRDMKKAKYYWELAAMGGDLSARHNLACLEGHSGKYERATKHFILAARAGDDQSMGNVTVMFKKGMITKNEYANVLRAYQKSFDDMKSEARDKAAASDFGRR